MSYGVAASFHIERSGDILALKSAAGAFTDPMDRSATMSLDSKALEAVQKYRFTPGTKEGKPVPIHLTVE
jgi:hypothetical protein